MMNRPAWFQDSCVGLRRFHRYLPERLELRHLPVSRTLRYIHVTSLPAAIWLNRDDTVCACATGLRCRCRALRRHLAALAPTPARAGCAPARSARASIARAAFRSGERSIERGCPADLPCAALRRGSARLHARRHCAVRGCCPAMNRRPELCELRPKTAIRCAGCVRQPRRETFPRAAKYLRAVRATQACGG